ncbi:GNAT family N-acetyltransferase [Propionibacteriaceae bacterium Y1685]|uniref:GNAT family N-acetyltransferase n=1 Tax=Microlunatus sp. Y1700 TaxID=3418487 RepID=UPI003B7C60E5
MSTDTPLFEVALQIDDVDLRLVREADLSELADLLPADVDQDPAAERLIGLDDRANRRRVLHQSYWRALATFSPSAWQLPLAVRQGGALVGVQTLEGTDFVSLRTVDSASWLSSAARGRGIGIAMRTAVLTLAFDHLGALVAISSAEPTNHASLGVSRRLGYQDNGLSMINSPRGAVPLQHQRLTVERWRATAGERPAVRVSNLTACLPWFGLDESGTRTARLVGGGKHGDHA